MNDQQREILISKMSEDAYMLAIGYGDKPLSVIGLGELLEVEDNHPYIGEFGIKNVDDRPFFGVVESHSSFIDCDYAGDLKAYLQKDGYYRLKFTVHTGDLEADKVYEGQIGILTEGMSHQVPIRIKTMKSKAEHDDSTDTWDVFTNQKSYHYQQSGHISVINHKHQEIQVTLTCLDDIVQLEKNTYRVFDTIQIPFKLHIQETDIDQGIIPLNINPSFTTGIELEVEGVKQILTIQVTSLPVIKGIEAIEDEAERTWVKELMDEQYAGAIVFDRRYADLIKDDGSEDDLLYLVARLINDDLVDVNMRLFYCYLLIEIGETVRAMEMINRIEHYILFYDQTDLEVGDVLLGLLALIRQDKALESVVYSWTAEHEKNWMKIVLKNRIVSDKFKQYDEYKTLFEMGVRHISLMASAFSFINQNSYLPKGEDAFYRALVLWGAKMGAVSRKLTKKLETSAFYLTRQGCVDPEAVEYLYSAHPTKELLSLLVMAYISDENTSPRAYYIYETCIEEKIIVKGLFEQYVIAGHASHKLLDLNHFRFAYDISRFKEPVIRYLWWHFKVFRNDFKLLTDYYYKQYEPIRDFRASEVILPETERAVELIEELIEEKAHQLLADLYHDGLWTQIGQDTKVKLLHLMAQWDTGMARGMALRLFEEAYYNEESLGLIATGFRGSLYQLSELIQILMDASVMSPALYQDFIIKAIMTRQHLDVVQEMVLSGKVPNEAQLIPMILTTLSRAVIIEDYEASEELVVWMIQQLESYGDLALEISILKALSYDTGLRESYEDLTKPMIEKHLDLGIMFPWYAAFVEEKTYRHSIRALKYFEYHTTPEKQVFFNYRIDGQETFTKVSMKHIVFGLFLTKVVLFYGEHMQYYYEEVDANTKDVTGSDIYTDDDPVEVLDEDNWFDMMNTIEISRYLHDEDSLEAAIEAYFQMTDRQAGKTFIL